MADTIEVKRSGIGFFGLLGVAFIVLKLTGVIAWSWWWVLAPLWGPTAVALAIVAVFLLAAGVAALNVAAFDK